MPGWIEPAVVNCHQSTSQGLRCTPDGAAAGGGQAVRPVRWIFGRRMIVRTIGIYQLIVSPLLPSACRFYPTCSQYMREAVERYGVARGVWMGVRRLLRCHPFHAGGFDPVR
jgi:uncharacterized protein